MKWKLSTIALLATVAGTWALTPLRSVAQQLEPPDPNPVSTSANAAPTTQNAYDAAAVLSGSAASVTQAQRDEAAQRLLSRHTQQGRQALLDALVSPDRGGRLAVARALAQDPDPDPSFIDLLFPLLEDPDAATAAGRALAGYKSNAQVLTRLIDRAAARGQAPINTRLAAIRALGSIPEKRGADALIQLLANSDESTEIHHAAAEALIALTGLDQNGTDPARWFKWWSAAHNKSDAQFRSDINALQDARVDRLDARYHGLISEVERLLGIQYRGTKTAPERQELMLSFLNSAEPEVRKIGIRLLKQDVIGGAGFSPVELQRLRDMIADSDPSVRRDVADTIKVMNDPDALDALLAQLAVEPDPTVRAEIAEALGPIHDLRAVPTLVKLLSDDSLATAEAAAGALKNLADGPLAADPRRSLETARALRDAVLAKSGTPGSGELRAACIDALAPLQQTAIVQDLIAHKLLNPGKEDSWEVRRAMLIAIGALNDPKFADLIVGSLEEDPSPDVQVQAIDSLRTNPRAPEFANKVGALLLPDPARGQAVSDEAWKFFQEIFPSLSEQQLEYWQHQLKEDPERWLFPLEALADKQKAQNQLEDLAATESEIGEAYVKLKKFGKAAGSYKESLKIFDQLPPPPNEQVMLLSLIRAYVQALLDDDNFKEAVSLATQRIAIDPNEQSNLVPVITNKAEELIRTGDSANLHKAQQLIELASKMPKLDANYQGRLNDIAADLRKKVSESVEPALPQSATVEGK